MPKKTLVRIEEGITAASAAYGCAALLDAGLEERLGPPTAEEEGLECGGRLAVRIARRLEVLRHNLEAAKEALERIEDELAGWRERRDRGFENLYGLAKKLRGFCHGAFEGDQGDRFLGLRGSLPRTPKRLHATFGPVVRRLTDVEWPQPEYESQAYRMDRKKVVKSILDVHHDLGLALDAIQTGETREKVTQAAKKRAKTVHDRFLDTSCRYLEASLELAGLDELVATVRPNVGRRGRPKKELTAAVETAAAALAAETGDRHTAQLPAPAPRKEAPAAEGPSGKPRKQA